MPGSDATVWDGAHAARYVYAPAWRTRLSGDHRAALNAWAVAQPPEPEPVEMIAAAIRDGRVAGAVIGRIAPVDFLKRPMVAMACRLAPAEADEGVGQELLRYSVELLRAWSTRDPAAAQGIVLTVPPDRFVADRSRPHWADSGLMVIRILPNGDQLRVKWFDHARF